MKKFLDAFRRIADIPHPSGHTEALAAFLKDYAEARGCTCTLDNGCLIAVLPASPGLETAAPVAIQGHIDMVAEKSAESGHDFLTDPLCLIETDGLLRADGTTLGADDGVGIAYMMMLINERDLPRPRLYLIMTRDEETDMGGAAGIDAALFADARYFINVDSELEGELTLGSAGGELVDVSCCFASEMLCAPRYRIVVSGLTGGHSGAEIINGGAHAIRCASRVLSHLENNLTDFYLVSVEGDDKDNVITKEAAAVFASNDPPEQIEAAFTEVADRLKRLCHKTDPDMSAALTPLGTENTRAFTAEDVLFVLNTVPYGVLRRDAETPLASLNLGRCCAVDGALDFELSLRFADADCRAEIEETVFDFLDKTGARYSVDGYYAPWPRRADSTLEQTATRVWEDLRGEKLKKVQIHGGLECSFFAEKLPHAELISFDPTMTGVHTPEETLDLASADRVYTYLCALIKALSGQSDTASTADVSPAVITRTDGSALSVKALYDHKNNTVPCTGCSETD